MSETRAQLEAIADRLESLGAQAIAVVTRDGLPVFDRLPSSAFPEAVAAMAAASLAAAESACSEAGLPAIQSMHVHAGDRQAVVFGLEDALILAIAGAGADVSGWDEATRAGA